VIRVVRLTKKAQKDLDQIPEIIERKLKIWVALVETESLEAARKIPGFHDEPLKGKRAGQRSIRLSRNYRAIYVIKADAIVEFASVEEVNHHDY